MVNRRKRTWHRVYCGITLAFVIVICYAVNVVCSAQVHIEEENFQSAEYFVQEAPPGFSVTGFRTFWLSFNRC